MYRKDRESKNDRKRKIIKKGDYKKRRNLITFFPLKHAICLLAHRITAEYTFLVSNQYLRDRDFPTIDYLPYLYPVLKICISKWVSQQMQFPTFLQFSDNYCRLLHLFLATLNKNTLFSDDSLKQFLLLVAPF